MPAFYPQAMTGQGPLTPPYSGTYDHPSCHSMRYHHDSYAPQQHVPPRLDSAMDYTHRYPPPSMNQATFTRQPYCNPQSLPPINSYYEPLGAPILPPLRMQDAAYADRDYYHQYTHSVTDQVTQPQQAEAKEEQPTGGVSAKLDYEMERMTDFVAEAAQGIIQPGTTVHPSFRKWVFQVLSATRLPSATILLSLHYLTVRMQDFPTSIEKTDNQLYRLLAVSLILGSKFLDDNTFINRSWSDVSGIKVTELNNLEIKWLALISFNLHADPSDPNGVSLWIRAWKEFEIPACSQTRPTALSPSNTGVSQSKSSSASRVSYSSGLAKAVHGTFTPMSSGSANSATGTPYASADPWNRPDFSQAEFFPNFQYSNNYMSQPQGRGPRYSQYSLPPLHSLGSFYNSWNQGSWEPHHGYGCHCAGCSRQTASSYMMGSQFAPQTVVG